MSKLNGSFRNVYAALFNRSEAFGGHLFLFSNFCFYILPKIYFLQKSLGLPRDVEDEQRIPSFYFCVWVVNGLRVNRRSKPSRCCLKSQFWFTSALLWNSEPLKWYLIVHTGLVNQQSVVVFEAEIWSRFLQMVLILKMCCPLYLFPDLTSGDEQWYDLVPIQRQESRQCAGTTYTYGTGNLRKERIGFSSYISCFLFSAPS